MTFAHAAEAVLRDEGRPMTAREITDVAIARGLLTTAGLTPHATMAARLYALPTNGPIRRTFTAGRHRATRGSVRWVYAPDVDP